MGGAIPAFEPVWVPKEVTAGLFRQHPGRERALACDGLGSAAANGCGDFGREDSEVAASWRHDGGDRDDSGV